MKEQQLSNCTNHGAQQKTVESPLSINADENKLGLVLLSALLLE